MNDMSLKIRDPSRVVHGTGCMSFMKYMHTPGQKPRYAVLQPMGLSGGSSRNGNFPDVMLVNPLR